jgi:hypothetical protein
MKRVHRTAQERYDIIYRVAKHHRAGREQGHTVDQAQQTTADEMGMTKRAVQNIWQRRRQDNEVLAIVEQQRQQAQQDQDRAEEKLAKSFLVLTEWLVAYLAAVMDEAEHRLESIDDDQGDEPKPVVN